MCIAVTNRYKIIIGSTAVCVTACYRACFWIINNNSIIISIAVYRSASVNISMCIAVTNRYKIISGSTVVCIAACYRACFWIVNNNGIIISINSWIIIIAAVFCNASVYFSGVTVSNKYNIIISSAIACYTTCGQACAWIIADKYKIIIGITVVWISRGNIWRVYLTFYNNSVVVRISIFWNTAINAGNRMVTLY